MSHRRRCRRSVARRGRSLRLERCESRLVLSAAHGEGLPDSAILPQPDGAAALTASAVPNPVVSVASALAGVDSAAWSASASGLRLLRPNALSGWTPIDADTDLTAIAGFQNSVIDASGAPVVIVPGIAAGPNSGAAGGLGELLPSVIGAPTAARDAVTNWQLNPYPNLERYAGAVGGVFDWSSDGVPFSDYDFTPDAPGEPSEPLSSWNDDGETDPAVSTPLEPRQAESLPLTGLPQADLAPQARHGVAAIVGGSSDRGTAYPAPGSPATDFVGPSGPIFTSETPGAGTVNVEVDSPLVGPTTPAPPDRGGAEAVVVPPSALEPDAIGNATDSDRSSQVDGFELPDADSDSDTTDRAAQSTASRRRQRLAAGEPADEQQPEGQLADGRAPAEQQRTEGEIDLGLLLATADEPLAPYQVVSAEQAAAHAQRDPALAARDAALAIDPWARPVALRQVVNATGVAGSPTGGVADAASEAEGERAAAADAASPTLDAEPTEPTVPPDAAAARVTEPRQSIWAYALSTLFGGAVVWGLRRAETPGSAPCVERPLPSRQPSRRAPEWRAGAADSPSRRDSA
ncbi:hypothetical protein [Botrimarina sp.]|uniref:hypothetical protein n=1 Tax=Botrimarina sp. TaxID=2795802 RepID=UPI0032EBE93B